ncbi:PREDICTED: uncharacterized protein LOC104742514 [Camelina sativa]|uniref:Uncharacterized protein LOC104742514 n=1 Tax=Camelina sativa TaxID=90675 RepID=A0ABM0VVV0_CAMSA|nr:PREDICTED: uncharacterized protein LOC104742514 [Camelina sativa]
MVMAKIRTKFYVAFLVVLIVVGSVLLTIEGRPVKDSSRSSTQLTDSSVFNGSVMSSLPVESSVQDFSWLATVKQSGPSPGVGHHRSKGYKMFGRAEDSGPSPGVRH